MKRSILPKWIQAWLLFSGVICAMDGLFLVLRPRTFPNGDLQSYNPLWKGWHIYMEVDKRYGDLSDPFSLNVGRLNFGEVALDFLALGLNAFHSRHTTLTAFTTSCMVFWKTVFYQAMFVVIPAGAPDYHLHNSTLDLILWMWIPNCVWILVPFFVMCSLWPKIVNDGNVKKLK